MGTLSDQSALLGPREMTEAVITQHDSGEVAFLFSDFTGKPVNLFAMRDMLLKLARHLSGRLTPVGDVPVPPPAPGWTGGPVPSGLLGPADGPPVLITMPPSEEGILTSKEGV